MAVQQRIDAGADASEASNYKAACNMYSYYFNFVGLKILVTNDIHDIIHIAYQNLVLPLGEPTKTQ